MTIRIHGRQRIIPRFGSIDKGVFSRFGTIGICGYNRATSMHAFTDENTLGICCALSQDQMTADQPLTISLDQLRALRTRAHCLAPRRPRRALVDVVKSVCGINAQLYSAMALSLRARVEGLTIEDIGTCRVKDKSIVRTWCMRGTMHLLATDDIDWLLAAITPGEILSGWRWLERRARLNHKRARVILHAACETLKTRGAMTRPELMSALAARYGAGAKTAALRISQSG